MATYVQGAIMVGLATEVARPDAGPASLPVAATAGNLLVTFLGGNKSLGGLATPPTGFTAVQRYNGTSVAGGVAWRIAAGGEQSVSWTFSGNSSGNAVAIVEYAAAAGTTVDVSAQNNNTETPPVDVWTVATGTTPASTGAGFAVAMVASDSMSTTTWPNTSTPSWDNSFGLRLRTTMSTDGRAGLAVADRLLTVPSGTALSSTSTHGAGAAGTALDQMWASVVVFTEPTGNSPEPGPWTSVYDVRIG